MITDLVWPLRVFKHYPLDIFHTFILRSVDPEANNCPFFEISILKTGYKWPLRVRKGRPEGILHKIIVLS